MAYSTVCIPGGSGTRGGGLLTTIGACGVVSAVTSIDRGGLVKGWSLSNREQATLMKVPGSASRIDTMQSRPLSVALMVMPSPSASSVCMIPDSRSSLL